MRFLIVDDSKAMQAIVHKALVTSGYSDHDYDYAFNGKEALIKINQQKPDIVLTDWHMPEMSGLELLKKVKAEHLDVKIGLVTTERFDERIKEAKNAGAMFVVSKPFTAETLHKAIEDVLCTPSVTNPAAGGSESRVLCPSEKTLQKLIGSLSNHAALIEEISDFIVKEEQYPCIVCLYQDSKNPGHVIAVAIMDINGACNFGAAANGVSASEAKLAIHNKIIPKDYFDKAKLFLEIFATHVTDAEEAIDTSCMGIHMVNSPTEKFESLLQRKKGDRHAYKVMLEGYDSGMMYFLAQ